MWKLPLQFLCLTWRHSSLICFVRRCKAAGLNALADPYLWQTSICCFEVGWNAISIVFSWERKMNSFIVIWYVYKLACEIVNRLYESQNTNVLYTFFAVSSKITLGNWLCLSVAQDCSAQIRSRKLFLQINGSSSLGFANKQTPKLSRDLSHIYRDQNITGCFPKPSKSSKATSKLK